MDPDRIEALITDKTVAILPVHVYGNVCDVDRIDAIAKKHGLKVIYDAAHAFGVTYRGEGVANFGEASMFSFHATKVFHTIEGGAVCYPNGDLAETLNDMKNFGIRGPERCVFVGGNAKMSEFQAAMGICNLRHIDDEIAKRQKVDAYYRERLLEIPGIVLCKPQKDVKKNYAYFPVVFEGYEGQRERIFAALEERDITARRYFYPLTNDYACYRDYPTAGKDKTPLAAYLSERVLTLPIYADLDLGIVDEICDVIKENS